MRNVLRYLDLLMKKLWLRRKPPVERRSKTNRRKSTRLLLVERKQPSLKKPFKSSKLSLSKLKDQSTTRRSLQVFWKASLGKT
jgi:hypothetical protein